MLQIHQGLLETQVHHIFPQHNTITNAKRETSIKNPFTGGYLEVDVWLPDINLCFEFQDDYHYKPVWYSHTPLSQAQQHDNIKRNTLLDRGLTFIGVPYWWDGEANSLQSTVQFHRPDLNLSGANTSISSNPPSLQQTGHNLMLVSYPSTNVTELMADGPSWWWVGEKWDGIRFVWDSKNHVLYSRHNVEIELHKELGDVLGQLVLDGEIWCGRGFFTECQSYRMNPFDQSNSSFMRLMCFDEASSQMQSYPFEARYATLLSSLVLEHPAAIITARFVGSSEATLLGALNEVVNGGGEGLILQQPLSLYVPGRSKHLLKIKATYSDEEALVVKVESNGSLLLQLPNGHHFMVARRDCVVHQRAVKGDIVTFTFDFSKRSQFSYQLSEDHVESVESPVVHRIRTDLTWEDVLQNYNHPVRWFANEGFQFFETNVSAQKLGEKREEHDPLDIAQDWTVPSKRREYFDNFAASKGADPLNPVFWYSVTMPELHSFSNGCHAVISYYGKLSSALMQLYPDIGLQQSCFVVKDFLSWKTESDRKAYFDQFAAARKQDPLNPNFWYSVSVLDLLRHHRGFRTIIQYYENRLSTTLMRLYPNIGLQQSCFKHKSPHGWTKPSARKAFFDKFAASKGKNPRDPNFWHNITASELLKYNKAYQPISAYYGGKISTTLMNIYPDIGLQKTRFAVTSWKDRNSRRKLFCDVAEDNGFDPLVPGNWYSIAYLSLISIKKVRSLAQYYQGSIEKALLDIFPDIGFTPGKFGGGTRVLPNDRSYLENVAKKHGFDSLHSSSWLSFLIGSVKTGSTENKLTQLVLHKYRNTAEALATIFPEMKSEVRGIKALRNKCNLTNPNK